MSYLQTESKSRVKLNPHKPIKTQSQEYAMSPIKYQEIQGSYDESTKYSNSGKVQRNEFTQSIKNVNFSPIRHVGNSNNRHSFMSHSPTRYDEIYSQSKSQLKTENSPFDSSSPALMAHSEDLNAGLDMQSRKIKKQISSDTKAIKISKLIDFHREIENIRTSDLAPRHVNFGTQSATKAEFQLHRGDKMEHNKSSCLLDLQSKLGGLTEDKAPFHASRFELTPLEGDRFIPLRSINEDEELHEGFERKIEIESSPPQNLYEDASIESSNQNNNNQQTQPLNTNQEMYSGENLRKYNILLQNTMLDIQNPHMVQNGFLNENAVNNFKPTQGLQGMTQTGNALNNDYLQLLASDQNSYSNNVVMDDSMGQYGQQSYNVLNFNRRGRGLENQYPAGAPVVNTYQHKPRSILGTQKQQRKELPFGGFDQDSLLTVPYKQQRKICKAPFKVLDAPALQDDYYLNLVDWSSENVLAVGLGSCVYLWSASTSKVTKLYDLGPQDTITSVSWSNSGNHLAVGTSSGVLQNWDVQKQKIVKKFKGHEGRIGCVAWNNSFLSSGSRDKTILHRDMRQKDDYFAKLEGHKQEVCGLKWSPDEQQLASGGNDNKLCIWSKTNYNKPQVKFSEHVAAVKAIAWSPHQHGTMCSGGGTADRCIRFWNTLTCKPMHWVDTGSQVCNLIYSKNVNELVSTHGYSKNEIIVWKQPQMKKLAVLTGHTYRVLYLAMSPDGQTLVTGAGDETLRFWKVFPPKRQATLPQSQIQPSVRDLR